MEVLYYILHQPERKRIQIAKDIAPEILPIVEVASSYYFIIDKIRSNFGEETLREFIELHTDDEKFTIITSTATDCPPICLNVRYSKINNANYDKFLYHATACDNQNLFRYIVNNYRITRRSLTFYYIGVSYNPRAIDWLDLLPITTDLIFGIRDNMPRHPELVVHAKYVFDFLLEKLRLDPYELSSIIIDNAVEILDERLACLNVMSACEIFNQTGYFEHSFFVNLAEEYFCARTWLDLNDADV